MPIRLPLFLLLLSLLISACAGPPRAGLRPETGRQQIAELERAIMELGAAVDPYEARRAAMLAYSYSRQLAQQYQITDPPLLHNVKVNLGLKPRGLCIHWTRDMLLRLRRERFRSLDLHWAIANHNRVFRIEHSTAVISARGDPLQQGLVLDPWRHGGDLYWSPTLADSEYRWHPQAEVLALKEYLEAERDDPYGKR